MTSYMDIVVMYPFDERGGILANTKIHDSLDSLDFFPLKHKVFTMEICYLNIYWVNELILCINVKRHINLYSRIISFIIYI